MNERPTLPLSFTNPRDCAQLPCTGLHAGATFSLMAAMSRASELSRMLRFEHYDNEGYCSLIEEQRDLTHHLKSARESSPRAHALAAEATDIRAVFEEEYRDYAIRPDQKALEELSMAWADHGWTFRDLKVWLLLDIHDPEIAHRLKEQGLDNDPDDVTAKFWQADRLPRAEYKALMLGDVAESAGTAPRLLESLEQLELMKDGRLTPRGRRVRAIIQSGACAERKRVRALRGSDD